MKLKLDENLKRLRRERNITQEELADVFGVAYQSVSRWENGVCYPDMELLPLLSAFFETSVDNLLGVNKALEEERVSDYLARFQNEISLGNINDCILIAREGVSEYPNNFQLLNKLMYALFVSGDEDGNIPDWKENMERYDEEIVSLGGRIMKYCPDVTIRLEATARLAFHFCETGRKEKGRELYETLPLQSSCREYNIWWGLQEDEKLSFLRESARAGYKQLNNALALMCSGPDMFSNEDRLNIFEKKFALRELILDGDETNAGFMLAMDHVHLSEVLIRLGKTEEALSHLDLAAEQAAAFDHRPESGEAKCLLFGNNEWKRIDFETADTRSIRQIMREKWVASPDFDVVRHMEAFRKILKKLD